MVNTNMFEFKHPKYYTELRKRNREVLRSGRGLAVNQAPHVSDQVISNAEATAASERAPGQGHKLQAASHKHQASSGKLSNQPQASSAKRQASQPE
jgi:hypothetical protein